MKTLITLILLAALGAGVYWYVTTRHGDTQLRQAGAQAIQRADDLKTAIRDKLGGLRSNSPDLKQELERTGTVVRKKAEQAGAVIADAGITAAIKAKLVKAPHLSALRIAVNTTRGVVTLSGSVDSPEQVQEALNLALNTDGVREAISTLQVRASPESPKVEVRNP